MKQYLDLLHDIMENGYDKPNRTGVDTRSVFGRSMRFDLNQGFPLITTKKIHLKSVIYELLWFIKGDTNIKFLQDNGVRIWNEWADENGNLGPVYGVQWRNWNNDGIDQLQELINKLKNNPDDRRMIVSAWKFNIASYALLTMMLAQVCGLKLGEYIHVLGDAHIYHNHFAQVREQLAREPYPLPQMHLNPEVKNIEDFKFEDFTLEGYQCHPTIKAQVAV